MIAIGSDHGGVELKDYLVAWLRSRGAEVGDFGTTGTNLWITRTLAARSLSELPKVRLSEES
ncbi:MAG TPA: RpiB/LacA/LacB family sugar-phosphate isomerase [Candidatus Binatia bacterium]